MVKQQSYNLNTKEHYSLTPPDNGCVVGVDIGGTNLRLALADMSGAVLGRWSTSSVGIQDPHEIVALIRAGVEHLFDESCVPRSALRAIAVGAPGITDADAGVVIATSYLMGWRDVPLRALLEAALEVPAAVDNDVNVGAIGESWVGAAKESRDFVFLAIGSGVGAGIVLNRRLFQGMGWTAGEIGYMLVPGTPEEPVERGKPGALEGLIGGEGIKDQWQKLWTEERTALPRDLAATEIFDYALAGEPLAQTMLEQSARILAYAIYNISLILNCPLFVLGGGVGVHPALCEATRTVLKERGARAMPELALSILGADAQLIGAVRLALDTASARRGIAA